MMLGLHQMPLEQTTQSLVNVAAGSDISPPVLCLFHSFFAPFFLLLSLTRPLAPLLSCGFERAV